MAGPIDKKQEGIPFIAPDLSDDVNDIKELRGTELSQITTYYSNPENNIPGYEGQPNNRATDSEAFYKPHGVIRSKTDLENIKRKLAGNSPAEGGRIMVMPFFDNAPRVFNTQLTFDEGTREYKLQKPVNQRG
ncbi:MAG: hypothetical protein H7A33_08555, partial [Deltaproteobacteria bacterium]|nr:hypothetical protein [Deltaproteobacteria bacterium]